MAGEAQHFVDRPVALGHGKGAALRYFTFSWTPLRDEAGVIRGIFCNGLETTARVAADRAFRRTFEASPTPLLMVAPDAPRFTIKHCNDALLATAMRAREDLLGRGVFEACPDNPDNPEPIGANNVHASLKRVLATKRPDVMPVQKYDIHRQDGTFEERWWQAANSPVLDEAGEVEALIHHTIDVTRQHRAKAALRKLNAILEERVAERTAERNMLASLVEMTDVMVMAVDLDYNILALNSANADEFERIYGMRLKPGDNMLVLLANQPEHREQVRVGWEHGMRCQQLTFVEDYRDLDRARP